MKEHYVNPDCMVFVWAERMGETVVATGQPETTKPHFGPEAFVVDAPEGFESRKGRFIHGSKPLDARAWQSYLRKLVKDQHGHREPK